MAIPCRPGELINEDKNYNGFDNCVRVKYTCTAVAQPTLQKLVLQKKSIFTSVDFKMTLSEVLVYFAVAIFGLYFVFGRKRGKKNYPPGPWGFPLVGHILRLGMSPHVKFQKWAEEYGPIFSVDFASFPAVMLNDPKLVRAAFNDLDCAGRPELPTLTARSEGSVEGIIFTEGKKWQEQRRFMIRTLRDFGFGKKSMESAVHEEINELIESFRKVAETPQSTQTRFNGAVLNALWTLIAGERFKLDDPELATAVKHLTANIQDNNLRASLSNFFPLLAKYAPKLSGFEKLVKDIFPIVEFVRKPIDQHKATFQSGQPRDVIDVYLEEIEKTTDPNSSFFKEKGEKSLLYSVLDLFLAGAETTSTTLTWAFLYMAKFPHVQKKMQSEIDAVVGNSRLPSLSDRPDMPYTEAVIHEILRYSSLAPTGVLHNTHQEIQIGGYTIPANTMVFANQFTIHFDKKIWGDPDNFRPERFIGKDGEFLKNENLIPFSVGKRACPGESLARDELFLFIASLFQTFLVTPEESVEKLSLVPGIAPILSPRPHRLIFKERN